MPHVFDRVAFRAGRQRAPQGGARPGRRGGAAALGRSARGHPVGALPAARARGTAARPLCARTRWFLAELVGADGPPGRRRAQRGRRPARLRRLAAPGRRRLLGHRTRARGDPLPGRGRAGSRPSPRQLARRRRRHPRGRRTARPGAHPHADLARPAGAAHPAHRGAHRTARCARHRGPVHPVHQGVDGRAAGARGHGPLLRRSGPGDTGGLPVRRRGAGSAAAAAVLLGRDGPLGARHRQRLHPRRAARAVAAGRARARPDAARLRRPGPARRLPHVRQGRPRLPRLTAADPAGRRARGDDGISGRGGAGVPGTAGTAGGRRGKRRAGDRR
ncbi:putative Predicted ATPase related to phosphate starvation-inducible protein PhoH [Streptomyces misionensis JCM 4497]